MLPLWVESEYQQWQRCGYLIIGHLDDWMMDIF